MKISSLFVFGLLVLMWQGCDDDKGEQQGGMSYDDGGTRDGGDKADSGSSKPTDAGDEGARDSGSGSANQGAGAGGQSGSGGGTGGTGGSGGAAGTAGAPAAGRGGTGGAGLGAAGSAGRGTAGAAGTVAGSGGGAGSAEAGAGGETNGSAGDAAETAGAGGESEPSSEAGSGGAGGQGEAGSGGDEGGSGAAGASGDNRCGTRGGAMCGDAQFCNFEPNQDCGGTDRGGTCEEKPQFCNDLYQPVCGCDNRTHANVCFTHLVGASLKHEGLCTPAECSAAGGHAVYSDGASNPTCGQGELSWSISSGGDEPAVCCLADQPSDRTCGGIVPLTCDPREFCNFETSAGGQGCTGVSDPTGVCQSIPTVCTREYNPVCGCDKRSYANACEAHSSGTSIMHEGACTELDCAAVSGRVVYAPGFAAMCAPGEEEWTFVVNSSGSMAIEGAICCRQL